jgi:hypothetical protein
MDTVIYTHIETPIGKLLVARGEHGLTSIQFEKDGAPAAPREEWTRDDGAFGDVN